MNEEVPIREGDWGAEGAGSPLEMIGQLAGGIAHDFNNILGVILNYARFAQGGVEPGSEVAADIEEIKQAADRGVALVRQLMILARSETSENVRVDLNEEIAQMDGFLRSSIGEQIAVKRELANELWEISEHPARVEQVLMNLAVNARDAMPEGGTLTFETANVDLSESEARLEGGLEPGRFVRLRVTDTGIGMDAEVSARAFEPLFTTKSSGQGTGLGLATVFTIVNQAGGTINIISNPGSGTSMELLLPVGAAAPAKAQVPTKAAPAGRGERVLITEDEPAVRRVAERILGGAGYEIATASSGHEALELLDNQSTHIDLLLTDIVMPGMRGDDLARRAVAMRPGLSVLYMSGHTNEAPSLDLGPTGGRCEFIDKPFDAGDLLDTVRSLLVGARGHG